MDEFNDIPSHLNIKIKGIVDQFPSSLPVFTELYEHFTENKKRKLPSAAPNTNGVTTAALNDALIEFKDVSVLVPERKKSTIVITETTLSIIPQTTATTTTALGSDHSLTIPRASLATCLVLHVPDKAKPQWNVTLCSGGSSPEPLIQFVVQDVPADKHVKSPLPKHHDQTFKRVLLESLASFTEVVESDESLCVTAHRGSKDGLLYLLDGWVFFGFKKPMLLFPTSKILAISYSSITRLTFNLNVKLSEAVNGAKDYEFSMIDHNEYESINEYVINNGLDNQSMSEARRAKQVTTKPEFSNELEKVISEVPIGSKGEGGDDEDEELDEDYAGSGSGSNSDSGSGSESESGESGESGESDNEEDDE